MYQVKGCIFDLDGVICDTAKYHYLAWKNLAQELSIPFTDRDNERLKGVSRMESLEILLSLGSRLYTDGEKQLLAKQKNEQYIKYIDRMTRNDLLPGVENLLISLRKSGIKIALGSVSKNAAAIIDYLKIRQLFNAIIDGNDVTHAKPNPEVFLLGAKSLGISPKNCVVFEDAVSGVQAAHLAGMKCIGIGSHAILSEADCVVPNLANMNLHEIEKL